MAKGNPARQRMINMMYLGLTASSALNVKRGAIPLVNKGIERIRDH